MTAIGITLDHEMEVIGITIEQITQPRLNGQNIRSGYDELSALLQNTVGLSHNMPGILQMFNRLDRDDIIKHRTGIGPGLVQIYPTALDSLHLEARYIDVPTPYLKP